MNNTTKGMALLAATPLAFLAFHIQAAPGDNPGNDGRTSEVTCDDGACRYEDGTIAAQDIRYENGTWMWGTATIGTCDVEDACAIVWDHDTTSPKVQP